MFSTLIICLFLLLRSTHSAISLYATYHNIGITITGSSDVSCSVYYCSDGGSSCFDGNPLTQSTDRTNTLYGSIFWLEEGTTYEVTVTCPGGGGPESDTITTRLTKEMDISSYAHTLFVSPSGSSDSGSCGGDVATACDLVTGLETVLQDDTVVRFVSGSYFTGDITVSASNVLLTRDSQGATSDPTDVILDGSVQVAPGRWSSSGGAGNIYELTLEPTEITAITCVCRISKTDPNDVQRLLRYVDQGEFETLIFELDGFMISGDTLQVSLEPGTSPSDYNWVYSQFSRGIEVIGDSADVEIRGMTFQYYGAGSFPRAVNLENTDRAIISDCFFLHNDRSIGMKYRVDDLTIENNEFVDSRFVFAWGGVKSGHASEMEGGPLAVYASDPMPARGMVLRRNIVHDYFDCLGAAPNPENDQYASGMSNEVDVYENHIYHCTDDGMELDGLASNSRVYDNLIEDVLVGISVAPAIVGPTYVFNNVIRGTGYGKQTDTSFTGMAFKYNVGSSYDSGTMFFWHNVVIADHPGRECSAHSLSPTDQVWDDIILRNNILIGEDFAISVSFNKDSPGKHLDFDYDALLSLTPNELAWWTGMPARHLTTLEMLQTDGDQEHHGIAITWYDTTGGPLPFDASVIFENDYMLVAGSPLREKALILPGVNDGLGHPPHIGLVHPINVPISRRGEASRIQAAMIIGAVLGSIAGILLCVVVVVILILSVITLRKSKKDPGTSSSRKLKKNGSNRTRK